MEIAVYISWERTPERWKMLNCKMKFEIFFWKTVSGEHFVATPDWISKMEIAVWILGKDFWMVLN